MEGAKERKDEKRGRLVVRRSEGREGGGIEGWGGERGRRRSMVIPPSSHLNWGVAGQAQLGRVSVE